ncbi:hypothetical protein [Pseudomonas viridiflava]|uniref:hypothetical protein n=1 Tax=Pseudomonas viridiflava TaxID=33069 RepID=UPI000F036EA0|nr:hypothetical protein [Pseudomonas viridiflava]
MNTLHAKKRSNVVVCLRYLTCLLAILAISHGGLTLAADSEAIMAGVSIATGLTALTLIWIALRIETAQEAFQQVSNDQLKRLLRDAERLNFWQAHDWYTGERTADGVWRFFHAEDAEGQCCTGASLREALDEFQRTQPDLRGAKDDADAWKG